MKIFLTLSVLIASEIRFNIYTKMFLKFQRQTIIIKKCSCLIYKISTFDFNYLDNDQASTSGTSLPRDNERHRGANNIPENRPTHSDSKDYSSNENLSFANDSSSEDCTEDVENQDDACGNKIINMKMRNSSVSLKSCLIIMKLRKQLAVQKQMKAEEMSIIIVNQ